ncbi:MAG: hypothetical protein KC619_27875, partial [Myxococcales bacterium]|nr:hypothetical protein [Myxococcales bacterium]
LPEVEAICDRVLILSKGKLVSEGQPSTLRGEIAGKETIKIVGRGDRAAFQKALGAIEGVSLGRLTERDGLVSGDLEAQGVTDASERVFSAVAGAGLVLRELRRQQVSLEDVFADLTTAEPEAAAKDEEE